MSIISLTYPIFIIITAFLYFIIPKKFQWIVLLMASTVFYVSAGISCMGAILATIVSQYLLAARLDRMNCELESRLQESGLCGKEKAALKKAGADAKKKYVVLSVLINIGLLCFVKYTGVFFEDIQILAPLGISFYTFKSLGYVIDVYRGKEKAEKNIFKLALFLSYFPAIIQGPIDRCKDLAQQLYAPHFFDYRRVTFGVQRMLWGYIKKLVIAERVAVVVNEVFNNYAVKEYQGFVVFVGVFLYGIQIYADFSGGMDIICGVSEVFGITLTENFRRPFMARSVAEFWQRWHITLGAWFRNYLFYPLSLSKPFHRLGKKCRKVFGDKAGKVIPPSLASFTVFLLIGIWHGAGWKYVVYGIYQALFVSTGTLFEDGYARLRRLCRIREERAGWKLFQTLRTVFIITAGRYFSRAADLEQATAMMKATLAQFNPWVFFDGTFYRLGLNEKNFRLMLLSIVILLGIDVLQEKNIRLRESLAGCNIVVRWGVYYAAILTVVIFGMYGAGYDAAGFIYQAF